MRGRPWTVLMISVPSMHCRYTLVMHDCVGTASRRTGQSDQDCPLGDEGAASSGAPIFQIDGSAQPARPGTAAASPPAALPMRAAFECSWLSREEMSTAARIAPATARPAPTRNARSKPLVIATAEL